MEADAGKFNGLLFFFGSVVANLVAGLLVAPGQTFMMKLGVALQASGVVTGISMAMIPVLNHLNWSLRARMFLISLIAAVLWANFAGVLGAVIGGVLVWLMLRLLILIESRNPILAAEEHQEEG